MIRDQHAQLRRPGRPIRQPIAAERTTPTIHIPRPRPRHARLLRRYRVEEKVDVGVHDVRRKTSRLEGNGLLAARPRDAGKRRR